MDIVERLREGKSAGGYWREKEAATRLNGCGNIYQNLKMRLHQTIQLKYLINLLVWKVC